MPGWRSGPTAIRQIGSARSTPFSSTPPMPSLSPTHLYNGLGYYAGIDSAHEVDAGNYVNQYYNYWYSLYSNGTSHIGLANGSVTVDVMGHLASYFKVTWSPSSSVNPAPMPDHLNLLLKTNLMAEASIDPGTSLQNNGLWALATATDGSPFGETASASAGLDASGGIVGATGPSRVAGYHLVRAAVDPATQIATVYLDGTMHYTASNSVPYGTLPSPSNPYGQITNGLAHAHAASGISAGILTDNREVTLHRHGARQNGKVLSLDGKQYGEWVDPDGTAHGDTIYSYTRTTDSTNPYSGPETNFEDIINWQHFVVEYSNGWALGPSSDWPPDFGWNWSPDESDDTWDTGSWSMVHGNINIHNGDSVGTKTGPSKKTMTFTVSDNKDPDHATATANYELTIHDPIEWTMDKGSPKALDPDLTGDMDHGVSAGSDVVVTFDPPQGTLDYSDVFKGLSIITGTAAVLSLPATDFTDTAPVTVYIQMLLSGISATAGAYGPGTKKDQKTFSSSQANFEQDVLAQELINSGDSNEVDFPKSARFDDSTNFGDVQLNPAGWYTGHGGVGFWTVTAQAVEYRSDVFWTGMTFDEAGYVGLTHSHANYRTRIDDTKCVRLWHFNIIVAQ